MKLNVNGKSVQVKVNKVYANGISFEIEGKTYLVERELSGSISSESRTKSTSGIKARKKTDSNTILAPISGLITTILVKAGDQVKEGQELMVLEAMKMQNKIFALKDGTVKEILVSEGSEVSEGDGLVGMG